jgi:hypothetical protein
LPKAVTLFFYLADETAEQAWPPQGDLAARSTQQLMLSLG